jgi:hypothetical protein
MHMSIEFGPTQAHTRTYESLFSARQIRPLL